MVVSIDYIIKKLKEKNISEEELFKVMENTSDNILERFKELGLTKGNKR